MINYDSWKTSPNKWEEEYFGYSEEEESEFDYCDAHEEEWKINGDW